MTIELKCGGCGKHYRLRDEDGGKVGKCKKCGSVIRVPKYAAASKAARHESKHELTTPELGETAEEETLSSQNVAIIGGVVAAMVLVGIVIAWVSLRNGAPSTRNAMRTASEQEAKKGGLTQTFQQDRIGPSRVSSAQKRQPSEHSASLAQYEDKKHSFFSCRYPRGWTVRELDDAQSRRVQFLSREAEIRVRVTMAQGNEVPSSELTEMAKRKSQESFPKEKATFISERSLNVAGISAYEMQYRQHRPQARCRVIMLYANRRLNILMFAAPTDSLFKKWSDEFDHFLASYAVPESDAVSSPSSPETEVSMGLQTWKAYTDPKGRFVCQVPPGWTIDEKKGDPRSKVRFLCSAAEIGIITRDTNRHILDESDRKEMVAVQQTVVKKAKAMGQEARLIGVEWASVGGIKALKAETEFIRPEQFWARQMKFKRDGWDHTITLMVRSSDQRQDIERLFDEFLQEYKSPPSGSRSNQNSDSVNPTPDTRTLSVFQNTNLITFFRGERVSEIPVSSGSGPFGIPQFKENKAPPGFYFYVVESRVNTLAWPKEKIEFGGQDGVKIKSTDIVLETNDGRRIHPSFASYMSDFRTKKRAFAPGPLRNIALVFGQGAVDGKPADIMEIYVARPGPRGDLVAVEKGGAIDPDRKAFRIDFAFSVPVGARIKTVGLIDK